MGFFDIYTVIFLVIAVVIMLKLRSVLGTKTGAERPPVDRYAPPRPDVVDPRQPVDNVVPIPRAPGAADSPSEPPRPSALDEALRLIAQADRSFDQQRFIDGAKVAYEMIVTGFAAGDRKALKPLLSKDVFDSFSKALDGREQVGERVETRFVGVERAEIVEAAVKSGTTEVTVRFVSQLITATMDKQGVVIDGDASRVSEVVDVWTFARDVASPDPNWRLVSTASG